MTAVDCKVCRLAEMTPRQRAAEYLAVRLGLRPALTTAEYMIHVGEIYRAAAGIPVRTAYERHRDAYVATGDLAELERMLRHVTPEAPAPRPAHTTAPPAGRRRARRGARTA